MKRRVRKLVTQHLENISRKALEDYQRNIQDYIKGKQGVYALYRGDRLKYVGLATDLRNRLKTHLKDRHALNWDKFSVYLTADDEHLRELEALVLRIATPKENRVKGKLARSENLRRRFQKDIALRQRQERNEIMGVAEEISEPGKVQGRKRQAKRRSLAGRAGRKAELPLALVGKWFRMRADYKGKRYIAKVRANGRINYNGKLYSSPSMAGLAITRKQKLNGWKFWKYRNERGKWVWMDELRKR
jgi:predicted GIY-YIG superfamily endonuclease